jgi:hypothetical protein
LPADAPTRTVTLGDWSQQPIALAHNRWASNTGATSLFAPGSVLADRYTFLEERVERSIRLAWLAPIPMSTFANLSAQCQIDDQKQVKINLPPEFWAQSRLQQSGDEVTFNIDQVMYRRDALKLGVVGLRGAGPQLNLKLLDVALQTDRVQTGTIQLKYQVKQNNGNWQTEFAGPLPSSLVSHRANEFVLALGQLPIAPAALQAGTMMDLEIRVPRSFGSNSTEQVIQWQGVIGAVPVK